MQKNNSIKDLESEIGSQINSIKDEINKLVERKISENKTEIKIKKEDFIDDLKNIFSNRNFDNLLVEKIADGIFDFYQRKLSSEKEDSQPSKEYKPQIKVAFQGIDGAYSQLAGKKYFSETDYEVSFIGMPSFQSILESVEEGVCDYAILPIENTTAGSVNEAYDLLMNSKISIVGEEILEVNHCLMAIENVPLGRIKRIYSHPQAIAQCSIFLSTLEGCKIESFIDTAMAIKKVKDDDDISQAAIGSSEAARLYGLPIIKNDIANSRENYTRFFIISKNPIEYPDDLPCKTTMILATKHVEGALVHCLNVLAKYHLNLTKIQSRPRPNVPWEYLFHVDFEGYIKNPTVKEALEELTSEVSYMRILGSYPSRALPGYIKPAQRVKESEDGENIEMPELPKSGLTVPEKKSYKLVSRYYKNENSQIRVQDIIIGGKDFVVIAGPCSIESEEQIFECAKVVAENKGHILRGGAFKPRTSPYSFQGLGFNGLEMMSRAGRQYNLPIITEVMHPKDVQKISMISDIIQIGARNMQNFPLLSELGCINKPILLKRGMMSSIDELLSAAEYILKQGNQQVILCERGIRTFETATRNTLDLSAVPILKHHSHLPVIVDPSHAVGDWRWVIPMVEASFVAGADGIMVEMHPNPAKALSDGEQSLNFDNFRIMMQRLNVLKQIGRVQ